jgi:tRNA(Ile)-lysidine synthase
MVALPTQKLTHVNFPSLNAIEHLSSFAVALSGGADSTAMLLACAKRWPDRTYAVHVHHGLQEAADSFEAHCIALCQQLAVPLVVQRVDATHATGESPEDAARQARYKAFSAALESNWGGSVKNVVLAQHADDQVETLLLALSRGAGLPGLASMPTKATRNGITYFRPWLDVPGQLLRSALTEVGQPWVEDPTNADTRYTRNRIRADVLPVIERAFPSYRQTFARSASHAAQAQVLLQEIAEQDLLQVGNPPQIKSLQQLSQVRQSNVLRHWLALEHSQASAAQLLALQVQVSACTTRGHHIDIKVGRGFVRRDGAVLRCYNL